MLNPVAPERSVPLDSAVKSIGTPAASSVESTPVPVTGVKAELVTEESAAGFVGFDKGADGLIPRARSEASDAGLREARELIIYNRSVNS